MFSHCTATFSKVRCGPSELNYLLKHILSHTLLKHQQQVVSANNILSHFTATFSNIRCGTVWTELSFKTLSSIIKKMVHTNDMFSQCTATFKSILKHKKQGNASDMFAHCTVYVFKLRCGTFWTDFFFKTHTLTHSPQSSKTGGGCEQFVFAFNARFFKHKVRDRLDRLPFKTHTLAHSPQS